MIKKALINKYENKTTPLCHVNTHTTPTPPRKKNLKSPNPENQPTMEMGPLQLGAKCPVWVIRCCPLLVWVQPVHNLLWLRLVWGLGLTTKQLPQNWIEYSMLSMGCSSQLPSTWSELAKHPSVLWICLSLSLAWYIKYYIKLWLWHQSWQKKSYHWGVNYFSVTHPWKYFKNI